MSDLPPGFRFFPTDEELVVHFLHCKASCLPCQPDIIPNLDQRLFDPWELNGMPINLILKILLVITYNSRL